MSAESAPMARAVLALHVSDGDAVDPECRGCRAECLYCEGDHPWPCPTARAVATVLAADPEPREQVTGAELIAAERRRQVEAEGWTPEHDAEHDRDDLAAAAACYAMPCRHRPVHGDGTPRGWPWDARWWKPTPDDRIRELVKAGALIAAEIDRLAAAALDASRGGTQ